MIAAQHYFGNSDNPPIPFPLGIGWSASYMQRIQYTGSDSSAHTGAYAYRPDGSPLYFAENASVFAPGEEVADTLAWTYDVHSNKTGWLYTTASADREYYNLNGQLLSIVTRGGATQTLSYSSNGYLSTVTDSFGHALTFHWDTSSYRRLQSIATPGGTSISFSYDANDNLNTVTHEDLTVVQYVYELTGAGQNNLLTGVIDENSVRFATWGYSTDGTNRPTSSQHAGGIESYTFTYNSDGSRAIIDPLGTSRIYATAYVGGQRRFTGVNTACVGCGESLALAYDSNGNVAWRTDFNGNVTQYVNDQTRNLETSRTEAYGTSLARTITTTWNATFSLPATITEANRKTAFGYDSFGSVLTKTITDTTVIPNVARTWTSTYDTYGRVLTADGPRTDVTDMTTYAYYTCTTGYQCGQINTITNALGQITTYTTYNVHGQALTITDANNVLITLTYDARQRLKSRQVGTETTGYSYYPTGLMQAVTLPDSSTVQYSYDTAHRLTDITDGLGNKIHYTLDGMGNKTAENSYDPNGVLHRTHTRVINSLNEIYQDVNAAGTVAVTTTFGYDNQGNQTSSAAPLSRNTANQYDALNRLSQITDPASGITQFGYDANDNLTSVKDPRNLTTTYTHNGFNDLTQQISPDTGTTLNTYDSGGNLKTATDARGALGTYSYDALNRVTQVAYTDQTINFIYDAGTNGKGRLTGASDASHSMSWAYDSHGRVTGKGQTVGTLTKSVGYGYTNGDLTTLVTPSGQTVTYVYSNHRISSIKVNATLLLSGATYDPFGPSTGWTWSNGALSTRAFDLDGAPSRIVTPGVTAAVSNLYTLDAASRITGITDSGATSISETYGYDLLDRVTSGITSTKTHGYTYDANGNRLSSTGSPASILTIAPGSNRLSASTGTPARTYGYDAAGNTTSYTGASFTFNQRGRMSTATVSAGTTNYLYNALGQLIQKSGNGGMSLLVYDEAGHLLGEYSNAGMLIQETIWMENRPVATLRPNGATIAIYYVHTDHLGTPRKVTGPLNNNLVWRWDPDTFGTTPGPTSITYNLRYPGQYYLSETGLYYNYYRDYDPATGRYVESDPIGLKAGVNTYAYAIQNPVSKIDPLGLSTAVADRVAGTLTVTFADGTTVTYPVGNNTVNPAGDPNTVNSNGPAPAGTFPVQAPVDTGNSVRYGHHFFPVGAVNPNGAPGDIARQRGIGIHGGRRDHNSRTEGCLRVDDGDLTDMVTRTSGDPLTQVTIQ